MLRDIFKKKGAERVLVNQSTREIADKRKELNSELRASLYLYDDSKFIICTIAGNTEYGEPIVLDLNISDDELGKSICDKLLEFNPKNIARHTETKLSDWEAYNASGAKTGKAFENKSFYVYIRTINSAITIEARPRVTNEKDLSVLCTVSSGRLHVDIGAATRKAINAAKLLRKGGAL
jgi:hypothetical protein